MRIATPATAPDDAPDAPGFDDALFDMRRIARTIGLFVVVAVIVGVAFAVLPGVGEVRDRLKSEQPGWIGVAALCSFGSVQCPPIQGQRGCYG